jgi:hypothetical protein
MRAARHAGNRPAATPAAPEIAQARPTAPGDTTTGHPGKLETAMAAARRDYGYRPSEEGEHRVDARHRGRHVL